MPCGAVATDSELGTGSCHAARNCFQQTYAHKQCSGLGVFDHAGLCMARQGRTRYSRSAVRSVLAETGPHTLAFCPGLRGRPRQVC